MNISMKYEEKKEEKKKRKERKPRAMKTAIICGLEIKKEKKRKKITYPQPNPAFTAPYGSFGHIRPASRPISVLN